jgi:hypothetical protein
MHPRGAGAWAGGGDGGSEGGLRNQQRSIGARTVLKGHTHVRRVEPLVIDDVAVLKGDLYGALL